MANIYGRQVVLPLTNKSGGGLVAGDVVIVDTSNDGSVTTTTSGQSQSSVGIAQETIANNATGRILVAGYAALVNVPSSMTRGRFLETHTVAKQATGNATRRAGSFGQFLTGGTTPSAWLWGFPDNAGASGETVATSTLWDAKGDLAVATGADAASKLTVGANGTRPEAASGEATGIKWSALQSTLGTTSVGGSFDTRGLKVKKVTIPTGGAFITAIWAHVKGDGTNPMLVMPVVYADSAGSPTNVLWTPGGPITSTPTRVNSVILNTTARWMGMSVGGWFAAGDVWIGVWLNDGGTVSNIAYAAGTGSDKTMSAASVNQPVDSSVNAFSAGTNDYSIYADILR